MNSDYPVYNQQAYEKALMLLNDQCKIKVSGIDFVIELTIIEENFRYTSPYDDGIKTWYDISSICQGLGNYRILRINEEGDLKVF